MSNKALFYLDDPLPGTIIVLDDTSLSEEMGEILKGVTRSSTGCSPYGLMILLIRTVGSLPEFSTKMSICQPSRD
jgi:hypothetical protein